jgi:hypothetical protein
VQRLGAYLDFVREAVSWGPVEGLWRGCRKELILQKRAKKEEICVVLNKQSRKIDTERIFNTKATKEHKISSTQNNPSDLSQPR